MPGFLDRGGAASHNEGMKKVLFAMIASLAVVFAIVTASERSSPVRVSDRRPVSFETMIKDAIRSDVIVVGETHGNPRHHALQLEVIRALHESDTPMIIGMEMFRQNSQQDLDAWTGGLLPLDRFVPVYYRNWDLPWMFYEDILLYARDHDIPIAGLNIPEGITNAIARRGFSSLTSVERRKLPAGISCTIDKSYMEFIKKAYAGHGRTDEKMFVRFCEAQMVWDKSMAANLITFMKGNPGRKAVVLAGVGHAWRRGIPEQLSLLSGYQSQVILPVLPDQADLEKVSVEDADYVVLP